MATKKVEATKAVKVEAPKTVAAKVEAPKAEVKTEVKAEVKAPAKEVAPKKETAKKTVAKKVSDEKACNFYIQYAGKQFSYEEVIDLAKNAAAAEMGKKVASVKTIDIYCKPEEHAAYYVANGKVAGRIDL